MVQGFWAKLKKPFYVLAPMADVTDRAFRQIICRYGKPDACFTEFVSTDALCSEGRKNILHNLIFDEIERPIVAQIFGANPDNFLKSAKLLKKMGFDGIDINMGCPEKNIQKQGSCAALIKNPDLAKEIILATMVGAGNLPVSVKTRSGYLKENIEEWIGFLLDAKPAMITVHGRTKKEMSKVPADWEAIGRAAKLAMLKGGDTLVVGNGDVKDLSDAHEKAQKHGTDGVMIGRAVFGNPWLFNKKIKKADLRLEEILAVMVEHTFLFEHLFKEKKSFMMMRKHFGAYVSGFEGAKALRNELMQVETPEEAEKAVKNFLEKFA